MFPKFVLFNRQRNQKYHFLTHTTKNVTVFSSVKTMCETLHKELIWKVNRLKKNHWSGKTKTVTLYVQKKTSKEMKNIWRNTHIEDQTLFSLHRSECQRIPIFWFVNKKTKKHTSIKMSKEIWINASHNQELSLPRWEWCSFPIFWIRKAFVRMSFILPLINPLQSQCQNERPVRWDRTLTESRKENILLFESLSTFVRK